VVAFPQVSPPKSCMHLAFPPYVLHAPRLLIKLAFHLTVSKGWSACSDRPKNSLYPALIYPYTLRFSNVHFNIKHVSPSEPLFSNWWLQFRYFLSKLWVHLLPHALSMSHQSAHPFHIQSPSTYVIKHNYSPFEAQWFLYLLRSLTLESQVFPKEWIYTFRTTTFSNGSTLCSLWSKNQSLYKR
jgi:hypothetical protein